MFTYTLITIKRVFQRLSYIWFTLGPTSKKKQKQRAYLNCPQPSSIELLMKLGFICFGCTLIWRLTEFIKFWLDGVHHRRNLYERSWVGKLLVFHSSRWNYQPGKLFSTLVFHGENTLDKDFQILLHTAKYQRHLIKLRISFGWITVT